MHTQHSHVIYLIIFNTILFHTDFWRIIILCSLNFFKLEAVKIKLAFADFSQVPYMSSVGFVLYSKLSRPGCVKHILGSLLGTLYTFTFLPCICSTDDDIILFTEAEGILHRFYERLLLYKLRRKTTASTDIFYFKMNQKYFSVSWEALLYWIKM